MYILKNTAKKHLNIDLDYCDDDELILTYIQIAEDAVAKHLDRDLKDCMENGELYPSVKGAILLLIGTYYANRENVSFAKATEVPYTLKYLLQLDRKFSVG